MTDMQVDDVMIGALQPVYQQLNELIGTEATIAVWQEFKGTQLTLPSHLYNRKLVSQRLRFEYDGTNVQELARRYQYSEKWFRQVIKQQQNHDLNE